MKTSPTVTLLCHRLTRDTDSGIDRYSYELVAAMNRFQTKDVNLDVISVGNRKYDVASGIIRELVMLIRLFGRRTSIIHALSHILVKQAVLSGRRPIIATVHDLIPVQGAATRFYCKEQSLDLRYYNLCLQFIPLCDRLIVPFEITKRDINRIFGIERKRIDVIRMGVDHHAFNPLQKAKERPKTIVLFVGGLWETKGVGRVIQAFNIARKQVPNIVLNICGEGRYKQRFVYQANKLGIQDYVNFLGKVPTYRLPEVYRSADIFVYPSESGFSLAILEAMASGLPIIASNTEDIREIAFDSCLLVNPGDVYSIASQIIRLACDEGERERYSEKAYQTSMLYSWERTARQTLETWQKFGLCRV